MMTDPVQQLIDAGAIPTTPFVPQSRYYGVPLGVLQRRADDRPIAYVRRRFIAQPEALGVSARHTVKALDRPDLLAASYFGEPLFYWRIADANRVMHPGELTGTIGRRLVIPEPPTL